MNRHIHEDWYYDSLMRNRLEIYIFYILMIPKSIQEWPMELRHILIFFLTIYDKFAAMEL